jgi:hypothetical protein
MKKKRSKRTAFVPTVVFGTAVLGVIPACAVGCGGQSSTTAGVADGAMGVADVAFTKDGAMGPDVTFTVAAVGYCAFCDGPYLTVAAIGFDAGVEAGVEAGSEAGKSDAGDAASNGCPPYCAVAFMGFDSGLDKG